jgi:Family of unknown function (DUF6247)
MSAAAHQPAKPIGNPADLELPANVRELADGLPATTQAQLARELLEAIAEARAGGDLQPVQATVLRWRAIRKMVTDPSWERTVAEAPAIDAWIAAGTPERARPPGIEGPFTSEEFVARYLPHLSRV